MDKDKRKRLKKEYKQNPQKVKNLMLWRRNTEIVDICPICDKLFSKHSLKEMHVCEDKASVNLEEAKWNLEVVKNNWGKGGMIGASIKRIGIGHGLNSRMLEENEQYIKLHYDLVQKEEEEMKKVKEQGE